jgi:phosphopantetheinyl transferase
MGMTTAYSSVGAIASSQRPREQPLTDDGRRFQRLGAVWPRARKKRPRPRRGEVHLWSSRLPLDSRRACTSKDSKRWRLSQQRASDMAVRCVLARYLGCKPTAVSLHRTGVGSPFVEGCRMLRFSVSHAADRWLLAVSGAAVGVDVELMRNALGMADLMHWLERGDRSRHGLCCPAGDADEMDRQGLACWTALEAYGKALGVGLQVSRSEFAALRAVPHRRRWPGRHRWSFQPVAPWPDVVATVALRSTALTCVSYPLNFDAVAAAWRA